MTSPEPLPGPAHGSMLETLFESAVRLGDRQRAAALLGMMVGNRVDSDSIAGTPAHLLRLINLLQRSGLMSTAETLAETVVACFPGDAAPLSALAEMRTGRLAVSAAAHLWRRVLLLDPLNESATRTLSVDAVKAGRLHVAERLAARATMLDPAAARHCHLIGVLSTSDGRMHAALKWLRRAERLEPGLLHFPFRPADILVRLGDPVAALAETGAEPPASQAIRPHTESDTPDVRAALLDGGELRVLLYPDPAVPQNERRYVECYHLDHVHGFGDRFWAWGDPFGIDNDGAHFGFAYPSDRRFFLKFTIRPGALPVVSQVFRPGAQYQDMRFASRRTYQPLWRWGTAPDIDRITRSIRNGRRHRLVLTWPDGRWAVHPVLLVYAHLDDGGITVRTRPTMHPGILSHDPGLLEPFLQAFHAAALNSAEPLSFELPSVDTAVFGECLVETPDGLTRIAGGVPPEPPSLIMLEEDRGSD